jgi:hypothetical protein
MPAAIRVTHEAAIGTVDYQQLETLMARGVTVSSQRLRQALGLVLVGAGGFLIWQA